MFRCVKTAHNIQTTRPVTRSLGHLHVAGIEDSLFVQTKYEAHSIDSAVVFACAQGTVYTLQFLLNTKYAVLLDKVLCTESMNCQQYVAGLASLTWCSLRCSPERTWFQTGSDSAHHVTSAR